MYLIISDVNYQKNISYYTCWGDWLKKVKSFRPDYCNITKEDIEEIIVFSPRKEDGLLSARVVNCAGYSADVTSLRIEYGEDISDSDCNCETVRKNVYKELYGKGLLNRDNNMYAPSVLFIEDIQEYSYIKRKKKQPVNETLLARLATLLKENDWSGIVNNCPQMDAIEQDIVWDDEECLRILAFAYGKLSGRSKRKETPKDKNKRIENETAFLKVNRRCLELDPYNSMHKSSLAYFLYDRYKRDYNEEDFKSAKALYEDLIETSQHSFKEKYRYANLLRTHYELPVNLYTSESYKEFWHVIEQYEFVIDSYKTLSDNEKEQQRKNYRKALYQYVVLFIKRNFNRFWNVLFENRFLGETVPDYLINNNAVEQIKKCSALIDIVTEISPKELKKDNVNDKPGYIDIQYRRAQLSMSKGYLVMLRGYNKTDYVKFFEDAADILNDTLQKAKELKGKGARFLFPNYLKLPLALCYYHINDLQKCEKIFYHAQPWMQYEQARIYLLEEDYTKAKALLEGIPDADKCKNKANSLLERIEGK